jgi:hypothetical protein
MAGFTTKTFAIHDDYETPRSAWEAIKHFIPKDKVIWESFYCLGNSGTTLTQLGFNVIHEPVDFYTHDLGDIIVSNPPFSDAKRVMARLKELDKPFILIMPSSKLNTSYLREWKDAGLQIMIPRQRIQFNKVVDGQIIKQKNCCNFDCFYYCYKMDLPKDIIWLESPKKKTFKIVCFTCKCLLDKEEKRFYNRTSENGNIIRRRVCKSCLGK